MIEANKSEFEDFQKLHDRYVLSPDKNQTEYNKYGEKILVIIREWENKLCSQSEKGGYGVFTSNLADKFWGEVRKHYPKIDSVGLIVSKSPSSLFNIKKIKLS